MRTENFYTETMVPGTLKMICIDLANKSYVIKTGLVDGDFDLDLVDFVANEIFEAIIIGLQTKGFIEE
jgi:hypothetical protein